MSPSEPRPASWMRIAALAVVVPLVCLPVRVAHAASPPSEEQKRKDLMDKLGLPSKKDKDKDEDKGNDEDKGPGEDEGQDEGGGDEGPDNEGGGDGDAGGESAGPGGGKSKPRITYTGRVRRLLDQGCASCHAEGAMAGSTRFSITGELDADYRSAKRLVNTRKPASSSLLTKAAGEGHGGGATFPAGSSKYETLLDWIEGGARKGGGGGAASPAPKPEEPKPEEPEAKAKTGGKTGGKSKAKSGGKTKAPTSGETGETDATEPDPSWVRPGVELEAPPPVYAPEVHEVLQARCAGCHAKGSMAGGGAFGLSGEVEPDYGTTAALVDTAAPELSPLLVKARGEGHGGGPSLDAESEDYTLIREWIEAGALGPTAADLPEQAARGEGEVEVDATTGASPKAGKDPERLGDGTPVPDPGGDNSLPFNIPFSLPYHLRLNGRFDFSYERRDFKDHPFGEGRNAFQTYHHFLFLSRSGAKDPFGFNVELLTQQFYEFNARFATKNKKVKFLFKGGKLLVPFGNEPLFHSSYGGRTGFDQELLPVVWAQPGLAFNVNAKLGGVTLASDTYAVQGYALRDAEGVLNLQNDFSSVDNFQAGVGERVGISWAPISAWYSIQYNPLGFDRRLLMQALDLEFWRLRGVPFVEDLVLGLGVFRADVSGKGEAGGPGKDYYHFGSYGMIRWYPVDWLYLQYRAGLKTYDNRRNLYFDDTRMDERDRSSHNLTVAARYKGLFAAFQIFWNLEKANEQDDDFLRLTVGYEF